MKHSRSIKFGKAMKLLEKGRARDALEIGEELVSSDDEGDRLSGYFCRGAIYEDGGPDLPVDIERAIYNYRQVTLIAPDWVAFNNLARMSMKRGGVSGFADAIKYLNEASKIEVSPEVLLGYALYHRTKPDSDLIEAKRFYLRAAMRGRFAGLFGFSEVARELGQPFRAFFADSIRILLGPIVALLIGSRVRDTF